MKLFENSMNFLRPKAKPKENPFDYKAAKLLHNSCLHTMYQNQKPGIRTEIEERVDAMIAKSPYTDSGNFGHLSNLFSAIALYKILSKHSRNKEEVLQEMTDIMNQQAEVQHQQNQRIAKLPGFIRMMKKQFPTVVPKNNGYGWKITFPECGKNEFAFHMESCIYVEICREYECPELTPMFCNLDQIIYRDLPTVEFVQTGTIYGGAEICDFHFVKHE